MSIGLLAGAIFLPEMGNCETVSQREALKIAETFYNAAHGQVMASPKVVYNGRRLTTQSLFVPFYVYNFPAGGYVIVSAENKAFPILGYNLKRSFNPDKLGEKEKALLRSYALDIERIRYDSRIPYSAIEAWNDYNGYIGEHLNKGYNVTDVLLDATEISDRVDELNWSDDSGIHSEIYTPSQWESSIDEELGKSRNVVLGLRDGGKYQPIVVQGHQGDYYRLSLDGTNSSMYRLFATEYFSDGQVASLGNPKIIKDEEEEDSAFLFYDTFLAETIREERERERSVEEIGIVTSPEVSYLGGGHYVVKMPENIVRMNVYNVGGALTGQRYYRGTDIANIDISHEPIGFYIAVIEGESGKSYGIKLAR